jgi:hypothetical protein
MHTGESPRSRFHGAKFEVQGTLVEEIVKKALPLVCFFALCSLTLLAQTGRESRIGQTDRSAVYVAPPNSSSGSQTIFSNLGPPSNAYIDYFWYVDYDQWVGMAFTPTANAHVTEVQVGVEHFKGPKDIYVSLYSDSAGSPGTLLEGPVEVTKLPEGGTCCGLATADFVPLQVYGGQPYWVIVTTPYVGPGTKFVGGWYWVDQGSATPLTYNQGSGWTLYPTFRESAFQVLGTWDATGIIGVD